VPDQAPLSMDMYGAQFDDLVESSLDRRRFLPPDGGNLSTLAVFGSLVA
jgi:hypothetical protein